MYGMGHIGKIEQICTDDKNERKEYTVHKGKIGSGEPACTIKHPGTVTLETERLILRRFVIAYRTVLQKYRKRPERFLLSQ